MADGTGNVNDLLVVEDHPGDVRFIEEALRSSSLDPTVHSVPTRSEALDFVHHRGAYADAPEPDAVFLDWNLTRSTGEEVLASIKAVYPDLPVVVMTGSGPEMEHVRSTVPEADEFMEKPTDPEAYIEAISSLE